MTRIDEMTVADIMETDVTTVTPGTTVRELTRLLTDHGISGAPVVTSAGAVVGVVSSTDVVRLTADESDVGLSGTHWIPVSNPNRRDDASEGPPDYGQEMYGSYFLPQDPAPADAFDWSGAPGDESADQYTVADIMTPVSFTMPASSSVKELADFLLRGRIHRAIVTEDDHLVGIVTTMDVLRALTEGSS